jgi:hypothetical protein
MPYCIGLWEIVRTLLIGSAVCLPVGDITTDGCLNECLVERYCGSKHAHGNGTKRFQRLTTCTRSTVTTADEHRFQLDYVEDTAAGTDDQSHTNGYNPVSDFDPPRGRICSRSYSRQYHFRPVEDLIEFDDRKHYQQDISARAVDLATKLSYRDAASAGDGFEKIPSHDTIRRRVKTRGKKLSQFRSDRVSETEADTVIPDGTKWHSQTDSPDERSAWNVHSRSDSPVIASGFSTPVSDSIVGATSASVPSSRTRRPPSVPSGAR